MYLVQLNCIYNILAVFQFSLVAKHPDQPFVNLTFFTYVC
jgi:hypothetical protein